MKVHLFRFLQRGENYSTFFVDRNARSRIFRCKLSVKHSRFTPTYGDGRGSRDGHAVEDIDCFCERDVWISLFGTLKEEREIMAVKKAAAKKPAAKKVAVKKVAAKKPAVKKVAAKKPAAKKTAKKK